MGNIYHPDPAEEVEVELHNSSGGNLAVGVLRLDGEQHPFITVDQDFERRALSDAIAFCRQHSQDADAVGRVAEYEAALRALGP